jgi:hypothetical protein
MDSCAAHAKPFSFHRFPLATCALYIPDPVDNFPVVRPFAAWSFLFRLLRQQPSQLSPQWTWHLKIFDIFRLFVMILTQGVSGLIVVGLLQSERDTSSFSTPFSIYR